MSHTATITLDDATRPVIQQALANYITDCNQKMRDITISSAECNRLYAELSNKQVIASKLYANIK